MHVWARRRERICTIKARSIRAIAPDPTSATELEQVRRGQPGGYVYGEGDLGALTQEINAEAGSSPRVETDILGYARASALAPWFLLAGVIPLGFLLYRRNF